MVAGTWTSGHQWLRIYLHKRWRHLRWSGDINVINSVLAITLELKEIQRWNWSHCVCLVRTLLMTCNLTWFTGHRVTLTYGQIFTLTYRGQKVHNSIRLVERNTVVLLEIRCLYRSKVIREKSRPKIFIFFSLTWPGQRYDPKQVKWTQFDSGHIQNSFGFYRVFISIRGEIVRGGCSPPPRVF